MAFKNYYYRLLAKSAMATLTMLLILTSGCLATRYQVRQSIKQNIEASATKAVERVDLLLREADNAANQARPYLSINRCTSATQSALNQLATGLPHLRVISLLHEGLQTCSSFNGAKPHPVDTSGYIGGRLNIRSGSAIAPHTSVLVLLSNFPEGTIATSIDTSLIRDILSLLSINSPLYFNVGKLNLSARGFATIGTIPRLTTIHSPSYPYSITFPNPPQPTMTQLFQQGRFLLGIFTLLGIVGSMIIWRISFRMPNPYALLASAISRGEIVPYYQPIINALTGKIQGVEVLARWHPASGPSIPPDIFIPLAEKSGLIIPLSHRLMIQVAKDLANISERLHHPFHISFNISAAHFRAQNRTLDDFRRFQAQFPSGSIQTVAEITEREPFVESPQLSMFLHGLRQQGVQISLDDFGTGYSNLRYLNTLPIDYIKIDRSFTSQITSGGGSEQLVECVIRMARTLGMTIVAEGVETKFQRTWLTQKGVPLLQGYYFARAMSAPELIRLVILQRFCFPPEK